MVNTYMVNQPIALENVLAIGCFQYIPYKRYNLTIGCMHFDVSFTGFL